MDDVGRLRQALHGVEGASTALRWASERPWRTDTHVFWQSSVPTVDLHDLNAKLAKRVVAEVVAIEADLTSGAVCLVTGLGRRSTGPAVLGKVVSGALRRAAQDTDWEVRPAGAARWMVIFDPSAAPAAATGALGWGFWLLVVLFAAAVILVLATKLFG